MYQEIIMPLKENGVCPCGDEIPAGSIAYAEDDGDTICKNCFNKSQAEQEMLYDSWKEEQI